MQCTLLVLEVLAPAIVVIATISFSLSYWYGLETARARREGGKECSAYQDAYERHYLFRWIFLGALLIAICVVEGMVMAAERPRHFTILKCIHYAFDFSFLVTLVQALFWYNGKQSLLHGKFVRRLAVLGIGVLVTGLYEYIQFISV